MKPIIVILTLIAVGLLVAACGADATPTPLPPTPTVEPVKPTEPPTEAPKEEPTMTQAMTTTNSSDNLSGTNWVLNTLNSQPAITDTIVTLNFADGRATGRDGCNSYTTSYTADGTTIKIQEPMAATLMACPEPIMTQATAYTKALGLATTYKVNRRELTLMDASGATLMVFDAQTTDLAGTSWDVISFNNGNQAVVSTILSTTLTANFGNDNMLSGSAGCNTYTASYETDGRKSIKIGPAAATRRMCIEPQGVMEQEAQFLKALETAATYQMDGNQMQIRTADDALMGMFQRATSTPTP